MELMEIALRSGMVIEVAVLTWDHTEQIDATELTMFTRAGCKHFTYVDSGSDQYVLVCSPTELSQEEAQQVYDAFDEWDDE